MIGGELRDREQRIEALEEVAAYSTEELTRMRRTLTRQYQGLGENLELLRDAVSVFRDATQQGDESAVAEALKLARQRFNLQLSAEWLDAGDPDVDAEEDLTASSIRAVHSGLRALSKALADLVSEANAMASSRKELELAGAVQHMLVPPPQQITVPGARLFSWFQPAAQCGGDWWTAHDLNEDRGLVVVGDVTGHGAPSAIITGAVKGSCDLARMGMRGTLRPSQLMRMLNRVIVEAARGEYMMTGVALTLQTAAPTHPADQRRPPSPVARPQRGGHGGPGGSGAAPRGSARRGLHRAEPPRRARRSGGPADRRHHRGRGRAGAGARGARGPIGVRSNTPRRGPRRCGTTSGRRCSSTAGSAPPQMTSPWSSSKCSDGQGPLRCPWPCSGARFSSGRCSTPFCRWQGALVVVAATILPWAATRSIPGPPAEPGEPPMSLPRVDRSDPTWDSSDSVGGALVDALLMLLVSWMAMAQEGGNTADEAELNFQAGERGLRPPRLRDGTVSLHDLEPSFGQPQRRVQHRAHLRGPEAICSGLSVVPENAQPPSLGDGPLPVISTQPICDHVRACSSAANS